MAWLSGFLVNAALMTLILAVFLPLRVCFGRRIRPGFSFAAGMVLLVGLLIPVRPTLPVSLVEVPQAAFEQAATWIDSPLESETRAANERQFHFAESMEEPLDFGSAQDPGGTTPKRLNPLMLATLVWALGAFISAMLQIARHLSFRRLLRRWQTMPGPLEAELLWVECASMGIRRAPALYRCGCVQSPVLVGLFHPTLILPDTHFAMEDCRLMIRHELTHLRHRDLWCKAVSLAAVCVHWFNPLVRLLARAVDTDLEMRCDASVLLGADACRRMRYAKTVLRVMAWENRPRAALSTFLTEGGIDMKKRFAGILSPSPRRGGLLIALTLLLTLLTGSVLGVEAASLTQTALSPTTGLPSDKPYRPVLVNLSNHEDARPVFGLADADVVYETIYWGPIHTRYTALFNDAHPEQVGSIRGGRVYELEWREAWDCPFVSVGGQDQPGTSIYTFQLSNGVPKEMHVDNNSQSGRKFSRNFFSDSKIQAPHGAMIDLSSYVQDEWPQDKSTGVPFEPRLPGYHFSNKPSTGDGSAVTITIPYGEDANESSKNYVPSYAYNPDLRVYERFYNGEPQVDRPSNKRIVASNVIVQVCNLEFVEKNASRPILQTIGTGFFDAFIDGRHIRGVWVRPTLKDQTRYVTPDGEELTLLPGKTFIQIVPPELRWNYTDDKGATHVIKSGAITL